MGNALGNIGGVGALFGISNPPNDRNINKEFLKTVNAQRQAAPGVLQTERELTPQYTALALQNLEQILPGISQAYANVFPQISKANVADTSAMRAGAVSDVQAGAPGLRSAAISANPEGAALLSQLTQSASGQLGLGNSLSPADLRYVQQSVRARNAGSLGDTGTAGMLQEALATSQFANDLRRQREALAASTAGLNQAYYGYLTNPLWTQSGTATQPAQSLLGLSTGISQTAAPRLINPESSYANALYGQNYAGRLSTNLGNAQNAAQIWSSLIGAGGDIGGSVLG